MRRRDMNCPAAFTLKVISGSWKVPIVWHLMAGTRRFGELRKAVGGVTQKILAQQLRELEGDGIVKRKVYAEVPPKVEYSLTPMGQTLRPVVQIMCAWGTAHSSVKSRAKADNSAG
jgi:DNA-binding HxlR family transcriptional regulator